MPFFKFLKKKHPQSTVTLGVPLKSATIQPTRHVKLKQASKRTLNNILFERDEKFMVDRIRKFMFSISINFHAETRTHIFLEYAVNHSERFKRP